MLTIRKAFLVKKSQRFKQLSTKQSNAHHRHDVDRLGLAVFLYKVDCGLRLHMQT